MPPTFHQVTPTFWFERATKLLPSFIPREAFNYSDAVQIE
jgi:hypothetical protein